MQDARERSSMALASFALAIVGVFTFQIVVIPLLAVIFGVASLAQFNPQQHKGKWMAVTGLVIGILYSLMGSISLLGY